MATKKRPSKPEQQPSFEQAVQQLDEIVRQLEEGDLGLDEALARYEQGVKLLRQGFDLLQRAERKIELLSGVDSEGNPVTAPLEDAALSLDEKARQRSQRRSTSPKDLPPEGGSPDTEHNDVDASEGFF